MKQQKGILWLTETLALLSGKRKLPGCECMLWPSSEQRESQRHSGPRPLLHLPLTGMKAITSGWVITGPWVTPPKRWYKSSRQPSSLREGCMQSKPGRHHAAAEMPGDVKCACRVTAVQVNAASLCDADEDAISLPLSLKTDRLWETQSSTAPVQRNCVCGMLWWKADV